MGKLIGMQSSFGGMFSQVASALGAADSDSLMEKMRSLRAIVQDCATQFKNPDLTTFVCVCIGEFLSLYESERLIQEVRIAAIFAAGQSQVHS